MAPQHLAMMLMGVARMQERGYICWQFALVLAGLLLLLLLLLEKMAPQHLAMMLIGLAKMQVRVACCYWRVI
jgi:hypothetical protein